MTVKDRIMEFCRMSGIKPGRFERECGLSNAYLSKLKHEPSRDKLGKIFARYPELNKDWLLNGEGPMLNVVHYPAMEGGNELLVNDQEYYGLRKIAARIKSTEIMLIFFGIHTANVVNLARQESVQVALAA